MKKIKLPNKKFTIVDNDDYEYLMQWKWHISSSGYVVRSFYYFKNGKRKSRKIIMHTEIMKSKGIDHKNLNKLDNRKSNLRPANKSQNAANVISKRGKSKYKGVIWLKNNKKWQAQIGVQLKRIYLGSFFNEKQAAEAYNEAAIKYFGEFARINKF